MENALLSKRIWSKYAAYFREPGKRIAKKGFGGVLVTLYKDRLKIKPMVPLLKPVEIPLDKVQSANVVGRWAFINKRLEVTYKQGSKDMIAVIALGKDSEKWKEKILELKSSVK